MVPKIKDAVLDECISNCKTQPQNIFELTKFGIRKIIGGQKLSLHLKSIRSKNINDTQIVWRPVKYFGTQTRLLNQNHCWLQKLLDQTVL